MELDCPHLSLARHWAGEDLDKHIALVDSLDALRLCGAGAFETVSSADALWNFERESRRLGQEIADFAVRVGLASPWWSSCHDDDLTDLVAQGIARGDLVGLRKGKAVAATKPTVEQRRLVAQIDALTRGRLHQGGRHYRLVAGDDLDDTPDRDSYVVVPRDEAGQILDRMVKEAGAAANLATLLGQAHDKLTPDWRPPLAPDGLILLRRSSVARMHSSDSGPALTPSQIRKLAAKDWIEIEVVDQDGEPYSPYHRLHLADNLVQEGNFPDDGLLGLYEIESGTYKLTLGEAVQSSAAEDAPAKPILPAVAAAAATTPVMNTFTIRLVDEAGNAITKVPVVFAWSGGGETTPTGSDGVATYHAATESVTAYIGGANDAMVEGSTVQQAIRPGQVVAAPIPQSAPATAPASTSTDAGPLPAAPAETKPVYLRIHMDPAEAAQMKESFRLFSTEGSFDKSESTDRIPGDNYLDLLFEGVPTNLIYSLEVTGPGITPYFLFQEVPFSQLNGFH